MMDLLAQLSVPVQQALWAGFVVFLRVAAMVALLPVFGEQSIPVRVRLGIALAFAAIVTPAVAPAVPPPDLRLPDLLGLGGSEMLTGLFLGLLLRLFVLALQTAGTIAAQATSLSQIFGGGPGMEPQPAIGHVLVIGGLALAALFGLHVRAAAFLIDSYALVPLGRPPTPGLVVEAGLAQVSQTFGLAFTLAAPFVIASLIYNVTLGVINRAMPQLMVAFVGAPAITAGGLVLLMLSAPLLLPIWHHAFSSFLVAPFGGP